jgi:hypothetical protein
MMDPLCRWVDEKDTIVRFVERLWMKNENFQLTF